MVFTLILTVVILDKDVMEDHCLCLNSSLFCKFSVINTYDFFKEKQHAKNYSPPPKQGESGPEFPLPTSHVSSGASSWQDVGSIIDA